jgi:hypothetical protein
MSMLAFVPNIFLKTLSYRAVSGGFFGVPAAGELVLRVLL